MRTVPARALALTMVGAVAAIGAIATTPTASSSSSARVVVAVPDDPSNPYHEFFHQGTSVVTPAVLAEFGVDADHIITVTRTGDYDFDFRDDQEKFENVNQGELYWFRGTNLFAISFDPGDVPLLADHQDTSHGVGTTSAVLTANPEAIVIAIEGINDEAEQWAFTTPFIDVISTSYGPIGSAPLPGHINNSYVGVVDNGKVHVGASDNSPALSPFDQTSGPWWSIGVAGLHEQDGASRESLSGNVVDFVSDFTQELPYCGNCESGTQRVSGTSFATPRTAGTISKLILDARRALGHRGSIVTEGLDTPALAVGNGRSITNWDIRRAMEEGAWYPESSQDSSMNGLSYGVPSQAPYVAIGWGLVTPDERFDVLFQAEAHLGLVDGDPTRFKSAAACDYLTEAMRARQFYWDRVALSSESDGSQYPYIAC